MSGAKSEMYCMQEVHEFAFNSVVAIPRRFTACFTAVANTCTQRAPVEHKYMHNDTVTDIRLHPGAAP